MSVCSDLVGIIVIEPTADDLFPFWSAGRPHRLTNRIWLRATHAVNENSVMTANLPLLRQQLDREFRRLQDRLAA